jgi:hydroxyethylthiazole kinase-like uncharacterized protein yjeF
MKVATAAQTRRLEELAVEAGATWAELMARAGEGMARVAVAMLGEPRQARVVVLVGPGNNGGDGLVIARHLHDQGARVALYLWKRRPAADDWPMQDVRKRSLPEIDAQQDGSRNELAQLLEQTDLVVDALLGTGLSRTLDEPICSIAAAVNHAHRRVLAVDIPTGINSDTGAIMGCAITATRTATAGVLKPGLLLWPGAGHAGEIDVVPIGLPEVLENEQMAETMTAGKLRGLLPARPADSNKGTFGKVMVVGGAGRYPGAPYLAARGAQRAGAGLVTLATGRSVFGPLAASLHEATFLPLPEEEWGVLGTAAATELIENLSGYRAIVLGPGVGREDPTKTFVQQVLKLEPAKPASSVGFLRSVAAVDRTRRPSSGVGFVRTQASSGPAARPREQEESVHAASFVVDADALNLLAETEHWYEHLTPETVILTPHPGEMARLLSVEGAAAVNEDRLGTAGDAAVKWKQVVVLKGSGTVVAHPDGRMMIGPAGNPALATAGTGDVLAGLIGGLVAQGLDLFDAASLGVYLHAAAGELVRNEVGEAGSVAGDLLDRIPRAISRLRAGER